MAGFEVWRGRGLQRVPAGWLAAVAALAWAMAAGPVASAHPLSQGALDVTVDRDHVTVRARVTQEEVAVTNMLVPAGPGDAAASGVDATAAEYARHARYLAQHVQVAADGKPMAGTVVRVRAPGQAGVGGKATAAAGAAPASPVPTDQHAIYELDYRLPGGPTAGGASAAATAAAPPAKIELRHDVLVGASYLPGVSWEASYVVTVRQQGGRAEEGLLLTNRGPVEFACDWSTAATSANAAQQPPTVDRWRIATEYVGHGVKHILEGYDHLLFVSALVLAAVTFWDLVKVVSAFTLAHTLTLTLSALNIFRLKPDIVEPLIALSIVVVAAQNVFFPERSRGRSRLAAAFFFGLFHGLGFAGGLLDAMTSMTDGTAFLLAIAAFSLGVEVGHQAVVVPLFVALKLIRRTKPDPVAKERVSLLVQRYASAAISVAGMVFLVQALRTGGRV